MSDQRAPIPTRVRIGLTTLGGLTLYGIGVATPVPYGRAPLLDVSDAIMLAVLVCHSFIRDGQWQFLADSTHALADQTVPMLPIPN